jgi:AraC-like DNA-binding protein/CheY-like chemotaxis protein
MNYKILIVEDELLIARDISNILEKEGFETKYGITNTQDALNEIKKSCYNLVLIDVKLQADSDGIDIGAELLKKDLIPFIYITSHSDNITLNRIKSTRPHGIIIKPFKPIDVLSTVSIVLNNYKHKNIDILRTTDNINDEIPFILKNVIDFINSNIDKKLEITQLSSLTKWSHQHFIKLFTHFVGQTPYQYILNKKIEKAKALIAETNFSMQSIATELGFESYSNFFNAFKKETGFTPEQYRKTININKHIK